MTTGLFLILAGIGAGLASTLAGLASLVSYPALLATGLSPLAANVTNTTAMTVVIPASALGAREELRGIGRRVVMLCLCSAAGGVAGAALLLALPAETFEATVPWLIATGSLAVLARHHLRRIADARGRRDGDRPPGRAPWATAVSAVGIYAGYFGAAAGILMLALLMLRFSEPFAVTNAVKTIVTAAGNVSAAVAYAIIAPVDWTAVAFLGAGVILGSFLGPRIGRRLPQDPLRYAVGVSGLGLAAWLGFG